MRDMKPILTEIETLRNDNKEMHEAINAIDKTSNCEDIHKITSAIISKLGPY